MSLALPRRARVNPPVAETANFAGNCARTSRVRNLSFSSSSLLALASAVVRIRQATTEPRLISLPTNFCGFIAWAVWLRMGTEGTVKTEATQGRVPGSARRGVGSLRRPQVRDPFRPLTAAAIRTGPLPSLNLAIHRAYSAIGRQYLVTGQEYPFETNPPQLAAAERNSGCSHRPELHRVSPARNQTNERSPNCSMSASRACVLRCVSDRSSVA